MGPVGTLGAIWLPMPPRAWAPPRAQRLMSLGGPCRPWGPEQPLMSLGEPRVPKRPPKRLGGSLDPWAYSKWHDQGCSPGRSLAPRVQRLMSLGGPCGPQGSKQPLMSSGLGLGLGVGGFVLGASGSLGAIWVPGLLAPPGPLPKAQRK